jgi:hypothetical protein
MGWSIGPEVPLILSSKIDLNSSDKKKGIDSNSLPFFYGE